MKDIANSILTDAGTRGSAAVEAALTDQAIASPWGDVDSNSL
jgi:hypothetical protein